MGQSLVCSDHRAVFPSVTRVSAASIATGCHPVRHGLHGNRMALPEEGGFKVREVSGRIATPGVFFGNESPRAIILAEKR